MAWFSGKVSLGGFPDLTGAVNKFQESVKNIEKNFDNALGFDDKSDSAAEDAASSMWPPAVDTKSLFDPVMSFMGNTSDEKPDTLEDSVRTENPSQIEQKEEEAGSVKLATEQAVSVEANKETNVRREADQADNPEVTETVVLDPKDDEPQSQILLEESSEYSLQTPESSGYKTSLQPNEKLEMTASQDSQPEQPKSEAEESQPEDSEAKEVTVENKDTVHSPVLDGQHKITYMDETTNEQEILGENLEGRTSSKNFEVSPDINHVNRIESPVAHPSLIFESDGSPYESSIPKRRCEMATSNLRRHLSASRLRLNRFISTSSSYHSHRRVVVTGLGMVTPLGRGVETTWRRLIDGECGIRGLTLDDLKMKSFDEETKLYTFDQLSSKVAAFVPYGSNPGEFDEALWLNSKAVANFIGYAVCAADEALRDAEWLPTEEEEKERTGVSIGGGIGSICDIVEAAQLICEKRLRRLSPFFIPKILVNMASGHVSMKYGFQGPNHAAVTACATGAHSIGDATRMIQFGDADVMVAGGTESSIDALSVAGFSRSRALSTKFNSSPQEASRPFDCDRDGFVIGEGSGVIVLEEYEHAKRRGAKIYAELCGYGMSGDAHHITQPPEDGKGAVLAMTRALRQSGLCPNQIDYVNAHATSTPIGDAVEARAIKTVFSEHATSGTLAFSSTKGATGHLLGAAGAVEAIFSILAIHHGVAPMTLNVKNPDPIFDKRFMPLTTSKKMLVRTAMSNSFGFGGTNASLLFASI